MCHPNPDPGEVMRIAGVPLCMQCHSAIKTDSPAIQNLATLVKNGREIEWARIYEIPSYVNFSHRAIWEPGINVMTVTDPWRPGTRSFARATSRWEAA